MPNPTDITIDAQLNPSPNPADATHQGGVKFTTQSVGCTLCFAQQVAGSKQHRIDPNSSKTLPLTNNTSPLNYDVLSYTTDCPVQKLTAGVGNTIIITN